MGSPARSCRTSPRTRPPSTRRLARTCRPQSSPESCTARRPRPASDRPARTASRSTCPCRACRQERIFPRQGSSGTRRRRPSNSRERNTRAPRTPTLRTSCPGRSAPHTPVSRTNPAIPARTPPGSHRSRLKLRPLPAVGTPRPARTAARTWVARRNSRHTSRPSSRSSKPSRLSPTSGPRSSRLPRSPSSPHLSSSRHRLPTTSPPAPLDKPADTSTQAATHNVS